MESFCGSHFALFCGLSSKSSLLPAARCGLQNGQAVIICVSHSGKDSRTTGGICEPSQSISVKERRRRRYFQFWGTHTPLEDQKKTEWEANGLNDSLSIFQEPNFRSYVAAVSVNPSHTGLPAYQSVHIVSTPKTTEKMIKSRPQTRWTILREHQLSTCSYRKEMPRRAGSSIQILPLLFFPQEVLLNGGPWPRACVSLGGAVVSFSVGFFISLKP